MDTLKGMPNIVNIEDFRIIEKSGTIGWDIFIRMELLESFRKFTENHRMDEKEIIRLGIDICSALEICHNNHIIHRDIKPANIFMSRFGGYKIGDFGIAKELEKTMGAMSAKGTYTYMAPEVAYGRRYNSTVDIYSLGIVMYCLLNNNRQPFLDPYSEQLSYNDRKTATDRRLSGEDLPAPCNASPFLSQIILCACNYDPEKRFKSASVFKTVLTKALGGNVVPVSAPVPTTDADATMTARVSPMNGAYVPPASPRTASAPQKAPSSQDASAEFFNFQTPVNPARPAVRPAVAVPAVPEMTTRATPAMLRSGGSKRFSRYYSAPVNLYTEGCPVIIEASDLLLDDANKRTLIRCRIRNISVKLIIGIVVHAAVYDDKKQLIKRVEMTFNGLAAQRNKLLHEKMYNYINEKTARSFEIERLTVTFAESFETWDSGIIKFDSLPEPRILRHVLADQELYKQYTIVFGRQCEYEYREEKDLWSCPCGHWNHEGEAFCVECGLERERLVNVNYHALRNASHIRLGEKKSY